MRRFLAVFWTLGLLLHFYILHEFFLLDYERILSNLKLYELSALLHFGTPLGLGLGLR